MADDSDRVIPATPRRREEARRQGVMPSAALPAWVATAATATLLLPVWAAATLPAATDLLRLVIRDAAMMDRHDPTPAVVAASVPTVALVIASALAGLGVRFACDGFTWQPARLAPSLRRVDPLAGFARIASWRTARSIGGGAAGLATMTVAAGIALRPLLAAGSAEIGNEAVLASAAWRAAAWLFAAGGLVAGLRWIAARRSFEAQIRMTPEEFAEEARSAQADPKVKLLRQQAKRQPTAGAA